MSALSAREAGDAVRVALNNIAPAFRLSGNDLVLKKSSVDAQGRRHLRYQQTLNGLKVVGGELILHVDGDGLIYAANGTAHGGETVSAQAKLAPEAALKVAAEGSKPWAALAEGAAPGVPAPRGRRRAAAGLAGDGEGRARRHALR